MVISLFIEIQPMAEPEVPVNDVIIDFRELFKFHSYSSKKLLRRQIDRVNSSCNTVVKQEKDRLRIACLLYLSEERLLESRERKTCTPADH